MGGQDCKAIRVNARGEVTDFILNDKCAAGTGRIIELIAEALELPLCEVGPLSLESTKTIAFNTACAIFVKSEAVALRRQGVSKADILAGLHEVISQRAWGLLNKVGIEDKFVITGGIARNVGVAARIEQKLGGLKITIPPEPQIAGRGRGSPLRPRPGQKEGRPASQGRKTVISIQRSEIRDQKAVSGKQ